MVRNNIGVLPAKRQIEIGCTEIMSYSLPSRHTCQHNVRRTQSFLLGEYVQFSTPSDADFDSLLALEPKLDCPSDMPCKPEDAWPPPQQIQSVDHAVCISNSPPPPFFWRVMSSYAMFGTFYPSKPLHPPHPTCSAASPSSATCKSFSSHVILMGA